MLGGLRLGLVAAPRWPVPVVLPSEALVAGLPPGGMGALTGDMGAHIADMEAHIGDMGAHIMAADGDTAPRSMAPGP